MNRNLLPKSVLIVLLVALALWTLYPPDRTLKPGIDLDGGTQLVYAIDTEGMTPDEEQDLSARMITVLRRRIDPANIQNLVWRPQGNTRFEIQMPLASQETRARRSEYEAALNALLRKNITPATILRALQQPPEQRRQDLETYAMSDPNRLEILTDVASVYDERGEAQRQRDTLGDKLDDLSETLAAEGVDMERIEANRRDWIDLSDEALANALTDFLGPDAELELLTEYVETYKQQVDVLDRLTRADGLNDRYEEARRQLDRLNLTQEQIALALQLPANAPQRIERIERLKAQFPDRLAEIEQVVAAFDAYRPFQGQLDDPRDLQRMLKGAGVLEFRILPTQGRSELSTAEMERYVQALAESGPRAASDNNYIWCEIESIEEWNVRDAVVAPFGDKFYVLASNRTNETMLQRPGSPEWSLERASPSTDTMGRRAISFRLDERGGALFYRLTGGNPGRPLCILLDDVAISAPVIQADRPIGREGQITGTFNQQQVGDMVNKLNAGTLPGRLIEQPLSERTIGPSIGAENRDQGIRAGIIGLIVVMVIMLGYYLLAGGIADIALGLNIIFVLAIMAGLRATFTLPGIAGIILTIGMSVDANVLIFERIREEQRKGSGLAVAIKNGYQRAFRAIFDSNLTTFITAAILYYVASEEIKGFAIVLMLGIASSLFTALVVTRVAFDFLASKRIIKDQIAMFQLFGKPNVNWMGLRKVFMAISGTLIVLGLLVFFTRDDEKNNKYDIEFTGGTSVQINLKPDVLLTRQDVEDRIVRMGQELNNPALQTANIYSLGEATGRTPDGRATFSQYEITTTATNVTRAVVTFPEGPAQSIADMTAAIGTAQREVGRSLPDLRLEPAADQANAFVVTTSRVNPSALRNILEQAFPGAQVPEPEINEVVSDAVREAFEGLLEIQENLEPTIVSETRITSDQIDLYPELAEYVGGIRFETRLGTPASLDEIDNRLNDLRFRPDTQDLTWYPYMLFGPDLRPVDANRPLDAFVYVSTEPEAGLRELSEDEWNRFVANERTRLLAATQMEASLPRVTQIDPSIGSEQKTRALIAIFLSLSAIVAYVWVRFGDVRYGLAAIAALVHDVTITLGAITACTYIASTSIGEALLIGDFKINLAMIAALLTLIGYSLNDTIVVFDRIRENRHKAQLTAQTISNSINETLSRTVMTSITTFVVILVMYIWGGPGLRGFTFAIGFGVLIGTYSSIAISSPLLLVGMKTQQENNNKKKKR